MIGGVLARAFGIDWSINGKIEKLLVKVIEGGTQKLFGILERLFKIMELFKGLVPWCLLNRRRPILMQ